MASKPSAGRGGRKRRIIDITESESIEIEEPRAAPPGIGGTSGIGTRPRRTGRPSGPEAAQPTSLALTVVPVVGNYNTARPMSADLFACYGGFDAQGLHILEHFFAVTLQFGREDVARLLVALSNEMIGAVQTHQAVKNDLRLVTAKAEELFTGKGLADRVCQEMRQKVEDMKVV